MGQKMFANKDQPAQNQDFSYKGIQVHPQWGEVHVFEKATTIQAGERYLGQPATITLMFDVAQLRRIEDRIMLNNDNKVYRSYTLKTWQIIAPAISPNDLFDPKREPVGN